jgi:D-alanyl-D-alanine carboxypeptidase
MLYAIENPLFMDLASATQFTVSTGDIMYSINRAPQFIPYHAAGKTGFDNDTGYCLAELQQVGATRLITVTLDGLAPDIWYQDHAILADFGAAALQARVESGEPITGDIVALAPVTGEESGEQEAAQAEPNPTADVRLPDGDDGPRPVPVDATPVPVALRDETGGISGEWFAPLLILGVIGVTLVIRSGWRLPARFRQRSD